MVDLIAFRSQIIVICGNLRQKKHNRPILINFKDILDHFINKSTTMQALARLQKYAFTQRVYSNFYNGEFHPSKSGKYYEVYNPVTQAHIARSPQSTEEEFNAVVASAKEAFKTWSKTPLLCKFNMIQLVSVTCLTSLL
jgi:hypothetical protein